MQSIRLIAATKPLESFTNETGCKTSNDLIAYCARVSNPSNQSNFNTADKLLIYCVRNKHWSPFEMVDVVVEIKTTRDIARQILRHRSFSFQEFSQRYAAVDVNSFDLREARLQDTKNRQASIKTDDEDLKVKWAELQKHTIQNVTAAYQWALDNGIAKEQARVVLPEGLTPSVMFMKGSLRSWVHYCALRMGNGTQLEHQEIARMIFDALAVEYPFIREAIQ